MGADSSLFVVTPRPLFTLSLLISLVNWLSNQPLPSVALHWINAVRQKCSLIKRIYWFAEVEDSMRSFLLVLQFTELTVKYAKLNIAPLKRTWFNEMWWVSLRQVQHSESIQRKKAKRNPAGCIQIWVEQT